MNLDEFLFESQETEINKSEGDMAKSSYFDEFLRLVDNEYLINNILQSEFKFFCDSRMKKIEIDDEFLTTQQMLMYTDYFSGVLTNLPDSKEDYIKDTWNLLFSFFQSATKSASIYDCVKRFIKKMMIFSPNLRTEMILQLIKFGNNEIIEEKVKIWQSLAILSNYVMVEDSFFYYFLNYVYSAYNSPFNDVTIRGYASFVFVNTVKNRALDDRSVVPTISQIRNILRVLKMEVTIHFDDEKTIVMPVEVYDTCEQLKQQIFKVFKWKEDMMPMFSFYEVKENDKCIDENFVEDFVRISDVLASWELAFAARNFMPFGDEVADDQFDESFKLYLRPRYYFPGNPVSAIKSVEDSFLICELVRYMRNGMIKLDINNLSHAIALYCSMKLPQTTVKNMVQNVAKIRNLTSYLLSDRHAEVKRVLFGDQKKGEEGGMKDSFSEILNTAQDYDLERKKSEFVACFKKNPCYKTQLYKIKFNRDYVLYKDFPAEAIFYIGPVKLGMFSFEHKHLKRIKYENVKSVSVFKRSIILILNYDIEDINDNEKNEKLVFESNQAENIYQVIQNYISLKINGYFKNAEIKYDKVYEDQEDMVLDFELLDHLLDPNFAMENTNRYMKKRKLKIPKSV